MFRGKKYKENVSTFDRKDRYGLEEGLKLLKGMHKSKFDETVEVSMRLGVDPRHADQIVRETLVLPHGTGRQTVVLVFAEGELAEEAKESGADYVGADELVQRISGGWTDFDLAIAVPAMMSKVGKLGRILGPRGLMPNPKSGTVTQEVGKAVKEAKAGRVEFRVDNTGNVHVPVGKISFEDEELKENSKALFTAILRARPPAAKGQYVRSITLSSTMSPGIKLSESVLTNK